MLSKNRRYIYIYIYRKQICLSLIFIELLFSLKTKQVERPTTYDDIQMSPAMKSLPPDITKEESEMVDIVIAHIPVAMDDY